MALINKLTAIADSIREKTGKTNMLTLDQMPLEIAGIQTGVELGFEVVGGTSAPNSPKENTIWVNTDTHITGWGIGDYANIGWSMPEGYVYIDADTSANSGGDFNALKKNEIWLRPIRAKQRVNGAWVDKTAKIYQNGAWKSTEYIIVPNTDATWTTSKGTASANKTTSGTTVNVTTKASANGTATDSGIYTEFDATQYSTFYIKGSYTFNNTTTSSQVYKIQLLNSSGSAISTIVNKTVSKGTNTGAVAFEKTIDLTSVTGKCKLMFTATTYTTESLTIPATITSCKAY